MNLYSRSTLTIAMILAMAPISGVMAQDISTIAKSDPLIITGAIGTQNTYYRSSMGAGYASPLSTSLYANLNISCYGISMPFSFYYTGDNLSFTYPQYSFDISPTYKGWTLYVGEHSMSFSPYVYSLPFTGVGIEYQSRNKASYRFGAFYGTLKRAVNAEPDDISGLTPQYKRKGWGVKAGFGSSTSYIDVYIFRAQDIRSSIDEQWYDQLAAQENLVLGIRGRLRMGRHLDLAANLATSVLTTDLSADKVPDEYVGNAGKFYDVRYSSQNRLAGDVSLNAHWRYLNAAVGYKLIQPNYNTLGVSYLTNNYHSINLSLSTHVRRLSLSGNFSGQADNLTGDQLYTNHAYVYSASASMPIGSHLSLNASYNGYSQWQSDGSITVADTSRVSRQMSSWSFTPNYSWLVGSTQHTLSLSGNYTTNEDLNQYQTSSTNVETIALSGSYSVSIMPIETTIALNASHQKTDGYGMKYRTNIYSITSSRAFLKERELNASLTISLIDNKMSSQSRNLSAGGELSLSYLLKKVHSFTLSTSYNRYASTNLIAEEDSDISSDLFCSMGYNYTFSLLHIRSKANKKNKKNQ